MLITINVPDNLPRKRLEQRIREIEKSLREEAAFFASFLKNAKQNTDDDPWSDPNIELPSVSTGIEDFSINHDHYLYGTSKIS